MSEYTGFPEMMDGRVKTLHPSVHGGIMHVRGNEEHEEAMKSQGMKVREDAAVGARLMPTRKGCGRSPRVVFRTTSHSLMRINGAEGQGGGGLETRGELLSFRPPFAQGGAAKEGCSRYYSGVNSLYVSRIMMLRVGADTEVGATYPCHQPCVRWVV